MALKIRTFRFFFALPGERVFFNLILTKKADPFARAGLSFYQQATTINRNGAFLFCVLS
jgi:hypothetical protein